MGKIILGNIISFVASLIMLYSVIQKDRKQVYFYQFLQCSLLVVSSVCFEAYSGVIAYTICGLRNILVYKNEFKNSTAICFSVLSIIVGTITNNLGLLGFLPILATVQYTMSSVISDNIKFTKFSIIINSSIWCIYSLFISNISTCCMEFLTALFAYQSIRKLEKTN